MSVNITCLALDSQWNFCLDSDWAIVTQLNTLILNHSVLAPECMFSVLVLIGEPPPQNQVFCSLKKIYIFFSRTDLNLIYVPITKAPKLTNLSLPAENDHPHSMMQPPSWFVMVCEWCVKGFCSVSFP